MTLRFGLKEATIQKICAVLASYPQVEKAVLYGSRAKGNFKNGSDIDLTLCGGADLTLDVLYKIDGELDDLLLPYTIDLSIFRDISDPDVVEHIRRVGVTFYEKEDQALNRMRGIDISAKTVYNSAGRVGQRLKGRLSPTGGVL